MQTNFKTNMRLTVRAAMERIGKLPAQKVLKFLLIIVLMLGLTTAPTEAGKGGGGGGNVHPLGNVDFDLGSLIASGIFGGLGNQDVKVTLTAQGIPVVTCTNQGGNMAPGQNPPKVTSSGQQTLHHETYTKNGTSPFRVEAPNTTGGLTAVQLGCPNNNWTAAVIFVYWTNANITVTELISGAVLFQQNYTCVTTRNPDSVACTPTP